MTIVEPRPMTSAERILAAIWVALILCGLLSACDDGDDRRTILPTVAVPPAPTETVTCHDWRGKRPDRQVPVGRVETSRRFCLVGDVCFYGCPLARGTR